MWLIGLIYLINGIGLNKRKYSGIENTHTVKKSNIREHKKERRVLDTVAIASTILAPANIFEQLPCILQIVQGGKVLWILQIYRGRSL